MQLFYATQLENNCFVLDENDSRHATKVLRLKEGDHLHIVDGKGGWFKTEITHAHHKKTECKIVDQLLSTPLPYHLHVAIAPTKNIDRLEWFLEKATEMGISEITPLLCDHSERKVLKLDRLERIVVSAMKQSLKAHLPKINPLTKFKTFIELPQTGHPLIAHCEEGEKTNLTTLGNQETNFTILIGPEGDFSPNEIALAKAKHYKALTLGKSRLRTETAGILAVAGVYNLFGEKA